MKTRERRGGCGRERGEPRRGRAARGVRGRRARPGRGGAQVEALLAAHPEARAELDAIARTLAAVRAAEPRPHGEPDWDAMAREIQRACIDEPAPRPGGSCGGGVGAATGRAGRGRRGGGGAGVRRAVARRRRHAAKPSRPRPWISATALHPPGGGHDDGARVESAAGDAGSADDGASSDDPADEVAVADPTCAHPCWAISAATSSIASSDTLDGEAAPEDAFVADLLGRRPHGRRPRTPTIAPRDRRAHDDESRRRSIPSRRPTTLPIDQLADELPDEAIDAIDRFLAEVRPAEPAGAHDEVAPAPRRRPPRSCSLPVGTPPAQPAAQPGDGSRARAPAYAPRPGHPRRAARRERLRQRIRAMRAWYLTEQLDPRRRHRGAAVPGARPASTTASTSCTSEGCSSGARCGARWTRHAPTRPRSTAW